MPPVPGAAPPAAFPPAAPVLGVVALVDVTPAPDPPGAIEGALVVSVVVEVVSFSCGFSLARICSAWTMKLCQMIAG